MGTGSHREKERSGWSPLRYSDFRRWWLAQLTSNVGSWMQTVAAQWVMISLTSSAFLVGAIQATNLPVLLLAVPGGVLGDLLNRKKLIVAGQTVMLASAAALGALDVAGLVPPAVLLILLCGVGVGQGLTGPIAQTLQPELVPASERPQAIALGSVNQNLARAIGPAIGGLLLAARGAAFGFFASGVWALLPLVAKHTLGLGSGGYGLLLGTVGIGALLGATFAPAIHRALSPRSLIAASAAAVAACALVLAVSH